jgi:hypothetical protein
MLQVIAVDVYCKVPTAATEFANATAVSAVITVAVDFYCKVLATATAFANAAVISAAIAVAVTITAGATLATAVAIVKLFLPLSPHRHLCAIFFVVITNIRNRSYMFFILFHI